jgi:tetratricopeptide (TPR) repeat protein
MEEGNDREAEALYEESLLLFTEVGDGRNQAIEQLNLGCLAIVSDAYERAESLLADAAAASRAFGDTGAAAYALMHQAEVALRLERYSDARPRLREAIRLGGTSLNLLPRCFIGVALLARIDGDTEATARLVGSAEALLEEGQLDSSGDKFWKQTLLELRRGLHGETLDGIIEEWRRRPLEDAVEDALDTLSTMDARSLEVDEA